MPPPTLNSEEPLIDTRLFLWNNCFMSELIWGLTASQWAAVAAVGSLLAAAVSVLSIFISLRVARQSQRVTMQIHRESGPNPILTIWHSRTAGSLGSRHALVVRVEN